MLRNLYAIFKPAPYIKPLPADQIDSSYAHYRFQTFMGIFVGYAGYYLTRKNFTLAMPYLNQIGYNLADLGLISAALSLSYGLSSFFMGSISNRYNLRYVLAAGLFLSAGINLIFGEAQTLWLMFSLMFINGCFQGVGWPTCARLITRWFSAKERSDKMTVWNIAHNVGGGIIAPLATLGIALFASWKSIFYFPAMIAILIGIYILLTVRDTPISVGLPPIEHYAHKKLTAASNESLKEIFVQYIVNNKPLLFLALANGCLYFVRYGIIDWAPIYLTTVKGFSYPVSRWTYFLLEYAAIPGTILAHYLSEKAFYNRRMVTVIYMLLSIIAIFIYWINPLGNAAIDIAMLIAFGFLIYGPIALFGVNALNLVPIKAATTAAGFSSLIGYLGGAVGANALLGQILHHYGWGAGFTAIIAACILAATFHLLAYSKQKKR